MTIISRLKLDHPAKGTDPKTTDVHALIAAMWTKVGDAIGARFFTQDGLANGASVDFDHNLKTAFATLSWQLYLRDTGTGELTQVTDTTSPALSAFTVAATPGLTTTQLRLTNSSGTSRDVALVVRHLPEAIGIGGSGTLTPGAYPYTVPNRSGYVVLVDTSSARTINLPAHAAGRLVTIVDATGQASTNPITLTPTSGSIQGVAGSQLMSASWSYRTYASDGTNWHRIA
jgi:hypothetical protein